MDNINQNGSISKTTQKGNGIFLVVGWLSAIVSLVVYPFVFGVVGIIMGVLVSKNGKRAGMPLIVASIILMAIGLIFSGVFFNYLKHALGF